MNRKPLALDSYKDGVGPVIAKRVTTFLHQYPYPPQQHIRPLYEVYWLKVKEYAYKTLKKRGLNANG